jgi:5-formyltetrahydrofolate cyclo-ligase
MGEQIVEPKPALRSLLRRRRRDTPAVDVAAASRAVCDKLLRSVMFRRAEHLVLYSARPDEIDPALVAEYARRDGKMVYLPRVVGTDLEFRASAPGELRPGAFGLLEPTSGPRLPRGESRVLFLVPGLAFDPQGVRLGRGGGHYDRALAQFEIGCRMGLALDRQVEASLPRDPWDQPMDAVVTERRLLCSAARSDVRKENPL